MTAHKKLTNKSTSNRALQKQYTDLKIALHSKNKEISQLNLLYHYCKKAFLEFDVKRRKNKILILFKFMKKSGV